MKEFIAIGNITNDLPDNPSGEPRVGGGVTYAAIAAHRLGMESKIITKAPANHPYLGQISLLGVDITRLETFSEDKVDHITTFRNTYDTEGNRTQHVSEAQEMIGKNDLPNFPKVGKDPIFFVSPVLDDVLGGGIKVGTSTIITGIYKGGKTCTCLHIAKKFQKAGYKVYYLNIEHRLTKRDLEGVEDLDLSSDKFEVIQSREGCILSGEDFLRVLRSKIETETKCLFIADSYSSLCSQELFDGDIGDRFRDPMPLKLSAFCKVVSAYLSINNNTLIGITHEIANQAPSMGPNKKMKVEASGNKIQYASDYKLRVQFSKPIVGSDGKSEIGKEINWHCTWSCLGPPNREGITRLIYNQGIDEIGELVNIAIECGAVKKAGSWFSGGEDNAQGLEKFMILLKEKPEILENIQNDMKNRL